MNQTIQDIKTRRSIRSYIDKPISKDILKELVDCARLAPSARNIQPWHFIAITQKDMLKKIAAIAVNGSFIKDAAACIVVCADTSAKYLIEDGCAATENILIAAHSVGIGSCWVAGYKKPYCNELKQLLSIPNNVEIISLVSLGYPTKKAEPHSKKELSQVLHWERL